MKKIISVILVITIIVTIGAQAFAGATPWGDLVADEVVKNLEKQYEEEGTDYKVEVNKERDDGFNIIVYVDGTEGVDYFYLHFTENGEFVDTVIVYTCGLIRIIHEEE